MKKIFNVLLLSILNFFKKLFGCDHRFEPKDVVDLTKDPHCVFCYKPLSQLK